MNDETPPTQEPPADAPPEPPENPTPPAEQEAEDKGEKVPAWGQVLIDQVTALTNALTDSVEDPLHDDENPKPEPWHKRGIKK